MDQYYIKIAKTIAAYSHCINRKVGAVLVSEDGTHVLTATNDPFPSATYCEVNGCLRKKNQIPSGTQLDVCRCIHCEANVISQCAKAGVSTLNATIYTTLHPCLECAKILSVAGVRRVVYLEPYPDDRGKEIFKSAKIQVDQL